ncbi:hypothetical protein BV22DRAFT_1120945 [Leucogyrophana mollusca]|uniref:Uncharacterized protein n=1 Tax=Leucogyrophana mollusca TaxID=85980 RepID=A0ACB8BD62_9AGAM|nr:hypothetical protein BV22DRAFT_1120945 [Leucogyrophana mollusca]
MYTSFSELWALHKRFISFHDASHLATIPYLDIQEQARAETDAVAPRDALPGFKHRSSFPYVEAIIREAVRCHPAAPMGGPGHTPPVRATCTVTITSGEVPWWCSMRGNVYFHAVLTFSLMKSRPSPEPEAASFDPD